jgi:hypothetical protein
MGQNQLAWAKTKEVSKHLSAYPSQLSVLTEFRID